MRKINIIIITILTISIVLFFTSEYIVSIFFDVNEKINLDPLLFKTYSYELERGDKIDIQLSTLNEEKILVRVIQTVPLVDITGEFPSIGSIERTVFGPKYILKTQEINILAERKGVYILIIENRGDKSTNIDVKIDIKKLSIPERRLKSFTGILSIIIISAIIFQYFEGTKKEKTKKEKIKQPKYIKE